MECKYYSGEEDMCLAGMPARRIFADLVCTKSPDKCPVFIDIYGLAEIGKLGLGFFTEL